MAYTTAALLIILWLLGLVTGHLLGGLLHILLAVGIVTLLFKATSGPKNVW